MLALAAASVMPARAEFPPEGATSDPTNPSVASGDYPDPVHKGVAHHYVFYFDCGKRDWIGVSVEGGKTNQSEPPQAVGKGREFPSGPPPGSKVDATNFNRAFSADSGRVFVLRHGVWFDTKGGKPVASPNLCPGEAPNQSAIKSSKDSERRVGEQKPDQLPPPPKYNIPDPASRSQP